MTNPTRLQMIQAIITRLAANSGALKGFAVTIVTALLGIAINKNKMDYAWLSIYPIAILGLLDAYYLALERRYRTLYVNATQEGDAAWGLAAGKVSVVDLIKAIGSPSVWVFYGGTLLAVLIVALTA